MAYIIGSILVIIAITITGLIIRKRVYDVVDRLEAWKMDIMNRNIAAELARIKNLNLSGETQEKFESWKERWESIVTKELPDIEEYLFDAEEASDRYRFPSAKKTLRTAEQTLQSVEKEIDQMLEELDQLMESEEAGRKDIERIEPDLKGLRKNLSQRRHQFGKADVRFETELDELEADLGHYHELVDAGEYSEARNLVEALKRKLDDLTLEMEEFPAIYQKCKHGLPEQLNELFKGLRDMKNDGYRIEHLGFEKEVQHFQYRLLECMGSLEKGDTSTAKEMIPEIEERMAEMYQLLEKEALAKNYVDTKIAPYQDAVTEMEHKFHVTKEEVETLRESYYFEDGDMEKYLSIDKSMTKLRNQLDDINESMEHDSTAHSELRSELENGFEELESLKENHEAFKEHIQNLRKDETEAKEKLTDMKKQLYHVNRRLKKSNIPGVPSFIWNKMDEATERNNRVFSALEKQPLDMTEVQHALSEAKTTIEYVREQTETLLDQAYFTEQVIQYANRYRSQDPALAGKLSEAERLFRSYEYELALEQAARAVEEVEPGALKHIEEFQEAAN
ncbi:septation ring formation regulator EzrA [Lentibacillus salicampi]|uniref:Septation ring formation regulator EzrA n=1 Tax=Lentibacillus salicampi TaxID=175306 RepID=A0A4Y9ABI8_9BACI|nr:septation ring formation regulator EzrA [Lentibacillus salicampi]TFJ92557.1 septation ring formation regulator EzrA [Lentibacillus salicampi]